MISVRPKCRQRRNLFPKSLTTELRRCKVPGGKTVTNPSPNSQRWTRQQIRAARLAPLVRLLQKRGLQLVPCEAGNFLLPAYPGLIVKDSYWRWPQRNLAGNAIDFHLQVLGLSFHEAMRHITGESSLR